MCAGLITPDLISEVGLINTYFPKFVRILTEGSLLPPALLTINMVGGWGARCPRGPALRDPLIGSSPVPVRGYRVVHIHALGSAFDWIRARLRYRGTTHRGGVLPGICPIHSGRTTIPPGRPPLSNCFRSRDRPTVPLAPQRNPRLKLPELPGPSGLASRFEVRVALELQGMPLL